MGFGMEVLFRKLKDTDVFKTDVKQAFDFIRCAEDKNALAELVEKDTCYQHMEEDAKAIAEIDDELVEAARKRMRK